MSKAKVLFERAALHLPAHSIDNIGWPFEEQRPNPDFLQTLAAAGPDWGTRALFTVEPLKLGLLEGESTPPGGAVAYLIEMKLAFPG